MGSVAGLTFHARMGVCRMQTLANDITMTGLTLDNRLFLGMGLMAFRTSPLHRRHIGPSYSRKLRILAAPFPRLYEVATQTVVPIGTELLAFSQEVMTGSTVLRGHLADFDDLLMALRADFVRWDETMQAGGMAGDTLYTLPIYVYLMPGRSGYL